MTFNGIDNQTIDLQITNYQYPDNNEGDWDGNWLNIYLNVKSNVGNWQTIDPSLTTWEVQKLINWFYMLSKDEEPEYLDLNFTEPNLSFELLNSLEIAKKKFRIKFNLESRPKSATDNKEYFVDCLADSNELKRLANELETELIKYPERKPSPKSSLYQAVQKWWKKISVN
jgi:hypothetical protein